MARDKTPEFFLIIGVGLLLANYFATVQSIDHEALAGPQHLDAKPKVQEN
jgi:hypothetical protein